MMKLALYINGSTTLTMILCNYTKVVWLRKDTRLYLFLLRVHYTLSLYNTQLIPGGII